MEEVETGYNDIEDSIEVCTKKNKTEEQDTPLNALVPVVKDFIYSKTKIKKAMNSCGRCNQPINPGETPVLISNKFIHRGCFVCIACGCAIKGEFFLYKGVPYCDSDYRKVTMFGFTTPVSSLPKSSVVVDISSVYGLEPVTSTKTEQGSINQKKFSMTLSYEPASYQIANYNIHPPPELLFNGPIQEQEIFTMILTSQKNNIELYAGFQVSDKRIARVGSTSVIFTGMKVNKMGKIKDDLERFGSKMDETFYLVFKGAGVTIKSKEFRLVSSCSQVPKELRDQVRPPKFSGTKRKEIGDGDGAST